MMFDIDGGGRPAGRIGRVITLDPAGREGGLKRPGYIDESLRNSMQTLLPFPERMSLTSPRATGSTTWSGAEGGGSVLFEPVSRLWRHTPPGQTITWVPTMAFPAKEASSQLSGSVIGSLARNVLMGSLRRRKLGQSTPGSPGCSAAALLSSACSRGSAHTPCALVHEDMFYWHFGKPNHHRWHSATQPQHPNNNNTQLILTNPNF